MDIRNGAFVVAGGGSGLGAATARRLHASGARVVIADTNADAGGALAAGLGHGARFVGTDVTDEEGVRRALDETLDAFGDLRGVVNCAGIGPAKKVLGRGGRILWRTSLGWSRST